MSNDLQCTKEQLEKLYQLQSFINSQEQVPIRIEHSLHEGVYVRVAFIPKGALIIGALLNKPTTLCIQGHCRMTVDDSVEDVNGYKIFETKAGRKTAFLAYEDTTLTMICKSDAKSKQEAVKEITDETLQDERLGLPSANDDERSLSWHV